MMFRSEESFEKYKYYVKEGIAVSVLSPILIMLLPFAVIGYLFRWETYEEYTQELED